MRDILPVKAKKNNQISVVTVWRSKTDFVQTIKFICAVNLHVHFLQICKLLHQFSQMWENVEFTHNAVLGNSWDCIATIFDHQSYIFLLTSDHVLKWEGKKKILSTHLQKLMRPQELCCLGRTLPAEEHPLQNQGIFFATPESRTQQTQRTADSKWSRQQRRSRTFRIATNLTKTTT